MPWAFRCSRQDRHDRDPAPRSERYVLRDTLDFTSLLRASSETHAVWMLHITEVLSFTKKQVKRLEPRKQQRWTWKLSSLLYPTSPATGKGQAHGTPWWSWATQCLQGRARPWARATLWFWGRLLVRAQDHRGGWSSAASNSSRRNRSAFSTELVELPACGVLRAYRGHCTSDVLYTPIRVLGKRTLSGRSSDQKLRFTFKGLLEDGTKDSPDGSGSSLPSALCQPCQLTPTATPAASSH